MTSRHIAGARAGVPILDSLAAIVVAGFIGYAGYHLMGRYLQIADAIHIEPPPGGSPDN